MHWNVQSSPGDSERKQSLGNTVVAFEMAGLGWVESRGSDSVVSGRIY